MQLEPGPIPTLPTDLVTAAPSSYGLADWVTSQLAGLDGIEPTMDALIDPTAAIADSLPADGIVSDLQSTVDNLTAKSGLAGPWQTDNLEGAKTAGDAGIIDAYNNMPGEAFQAVPLPAGYTGPAPGPPVAGRATVVMRNVSDPRVSDYGAGQQYSLTIDIDPTGLVLAQYYQVAFTMFAGPQGQKVTQLDLGQTDLSGHLVYQGTIPPDASGPWVAQVIATTKAGAQVVEANLSWSVRAAPGALPLPRGGVLPGPPTPTTPTPPTTPPTNAGYIQVQFYNMQHPTTVDLTVNDEWVLHVLGPPNQPVEVAASFNGQALPKQLLGNTDDTGSFLLGGQATPDQVGNWKEYYFVGGVQWDGYVQYSVSQPGVNNA
jgi:hypothetical protein